MTAVVLLGVGDALPDMGPLSSLSSLGGVGVLAWVSWMQFQELRELRTERKETMASLFDRVHADGERLNETLRAMTAQCASRNRDQGA
jgi:hypothetical protein